MPKGFFRFSAGLVLLACAVVLLLPSISTCPPDKKSRARSLAQNILLATRLYANEYGGQLPPPSKTGNAATIQVLMGNNPKQIIFLESDLPMKPGDDYLDPWGQPFQVTIDDSKISVRSYGKNQQDDQGEKDDLVETHTFKPPSTVSGH
ncbi:hypothetical protein P0Y35_07500 [Kiritimatiellaeota bacterium B1221]|nr:hypothetical protein [Kiritimatiellaeota bacterium B1221]